MCADKGAGIMVQKDARVSYENSIYGQSQHTSQFVLINAAVETDRHLHVPLLRNLRKKLNFFQAGSGSPRV